MWAASEETLQNSPRCFCRANRQNRRKKSPDEVESQGRPLWPFAPKIPHVLFQHATEDNVIRDDIDLTTGLSDFVYDIHSTQSKISRLSSRISIT